MRDACFSSRQACVPVAKASLRKSASPSSAANATLAHATHERALLCFHAIGEHALVPSKVELFVAACVVGLLEWTVDVRRRRIPCR